MPTSLISTAVTLTPHDSVLLSMTPRALAPTFSRSVRRSSKLTCPITSLSVVCAASWVAR